MRRALYLLPILLITIAAFGADRACVIPGRGHFRIDVGTAGLFGSFAHDQIGYNRPFAGAGQYRTPVPGLYLCGGSTHPGGNITGLCGYNAAAVVAADLGLHVWWDPPQAERALAAL